MFQQLLSYLEFTLTIAGISFHRVTKTGVSTSWFCFVYGLLVRLVAAAAVTVMVLLAETPPERTVTYDIFRTLNKYAFVAETAATIIHFVNSGKIMRVLYFLRQYFVKQPPPTGSGMTRIQFFIWGFNIFDFMNLALTVFVPLYYSYAAYEYNAMKITHFRRILIHIIFWFIFLAQCMCSTSFCLLCSLLTRTIDLAARKLLLTLKQLKRRSSSFRGSHSAEAIGEFQQLFIQVCNNVK